MKKMALLVFAGLFFVLTNAQGTALPKNISVTDIQGKKIKTSEILDSNSNFVIVVFWATWSNPSVTGLNNLNKTYKKWQETYEIKLTAVSVDDKKSSSKVAKFVVNNGWNYQVLLDVNSSFKNALNVSSTPTLFIFNKEGKNVYETTDLSSGFEEKIKNKLVELSKK